MASLNLMWYTKTIRRRGKSMNIKVIRAGKEIIFQGEEHISLLEQLRNQDVYISAACGGAGKCGKCKVQLQDGVTEITGADRQCLDEAELADGWRLACTAYPEKDCCVIVHSDDESQFEIVSEHQEKQEQTERQEEGYDIGIDVGTTTIAIELVGKTSGQVLNTVTAINRQRAFGADVISRIQASNDGQKEALKESIRRDLYEGIRRLLAQSGAESGKIGRIVIAGNTTMGHLLMGYSCETLGVYPFTPVNIGFIHGEFADMFREQIQADGSKALKLEAEIVLLPGISTYVGADISAGMLACDFDKREKPCLLIDLGTNGEMALGNKDRILVTSTAAGPAFEGGNISCGMGSVPGAICKVSMEDGHISLATIGDKPPVGLCGTGVIETMCELVKQELVDETGMLEEDYFEAGFELARTPSGEPIVFTQKDVREIQLAKSAVRAGVETLLKRYGITYEEIDQVFLAGGFGYKIDLEKTIGIGMLPEEFREKTTAIGNSSLGGTVVYLTREEAKERLDRIVELSSEVELSSDKDFNNFYTEYMFFE